MSDHLTLRRLIPRRFLSITYVREYGHAIQTLFIDKFDIKILGETRSRVHTKTRQI